MRADTTVTGQAVVVGVAVGCGVDIHVTGHAVVVLVRAVA